MSGRKSMTEVEWLTCSHPGTLIQGRRGWRRTTRKLRLLTCACYRRVWHLLSSANRFAIEVAERHADGEATNDKLLRAQPAMPTSVRFGGPSSDFLDCGVHYTAAPNRDFRTWATTALTYAEMAVAEYGPKREAVALAHSHLARDVFCNPFRPVSPASAWLTPAVLNLAQAAYQERVLPNGELEQTRLLILADALEETGCANGDLLGHLRAPDPHVRGCWAVDLVLAKE